MVENAGVGGDSLGGMNVRVSSDVLAYNPDIVTVMGGTADVANDQTTGYLTGLLEDIYDAINAGGAQVIACTITPRTDLTAGQGAVLEAVNDWIRNNYTSWDAVLCDWNPALTDDGLPGYVADPALLSDAVHPNDSGHAAMAGILDDVLKAVVVADGPP